MKYLTALFLPNHSIWKCEQTATTATLVFHFYKSNYQQNHIWIQFYKNVEHWKLSCLVLAYIVKDLHQVKETSIWPHKLQCHTQANAHHLELHDSESTVAFPRHASAIRRAQPCPCTLAICEPSFHSWGMDCLAPRGRNPTCQKLHCSPGRGSQKLFDFSIHPVRPSEALSFWDYPPFVFRQQGQKLR